MGRNAVLKVPQMKRAAELYRDGRSRGEIAAFFGVSVGAVRTALRIRGVQMRPRKEAASAANRRRARPKVSAFQTHTEIGRWVWLNPANADRWQLKQA